MRLVPALKAAALAGLFFISIILAAEAPASLSWDYFSSLAASTHSAR